MRRFLMATTLACVLSATAFAGEVPIGGYVPPPPPPPPDGITQTTSATGEMPIGGAPSGGVVEQESDTILAGLVSILSLLVS